MAFSRNSKMTILLSLSGILAWLTLTDSGKAFARKLGGRIMELSKQGLDYISGTEGFSAVAYPDPPGSGKYSIGFGHQIQPNEKSLQYATITREKALEILRADTLIAERAVAWAIHVPLTQAQHDALVSFVFNIGEDAFRNGTVPTKINAGNFTAAAATMRKYVRAGRVISNALIARREQEASAFA